MGINTEQILELVERIYAAASDPAEFPGFLEQISALLQSPISSLILRDQQESAVQIASSIGLDPEYQRLYEEYYCERNIWFPGGRPLHYNRAGTGSEVVSEAELSRSEYFNDYLRPQGLFYMTGVSVKPDDQLVLSFSALRGRAKGDLSRQELKAIQTLVPHLQRALQIRQRLETAELLQKASWQVLDNCIAAIVLVDRHRRIRGLSREAEQILKANDGIGVRDNRLVTNIGQQDAAMNDLIDSCFRNDLPVRAPGGHLLVNRPSLKRPLSLLVDPLPSLGSMWRPPLAAILIRDSGGKLRLSPGALQTTFRLTPAESRLAILLAEGKALDEIGAELRVTQNTLRSQLKRIFTKTDTRRQGELISLILRTLVAKSK